ncbi:MAG: protein kinase [Actinomycetota bacterium]
MNQERWQIVKELFDTVLALTPPERGRFLDKSCSGNDELRREVENLLDSFEDAGSFLEQSAAADIADLIIESPENRVTGKSFGHYEIVRQIGAGGMGEVYLAQDKKLDRRVAVKILNDQFSRHESNLQRFIQEAKAASGLNHPNILVIHEIGSDGDLNYIVSEFVEGVTLREIIGATPLKLTNILDAAIQIAGALVAAHTAQIVHRDIKPENIMIRPDGFVKILDFGLAKLVRQKAVGFEESTVKQNQTAKGVIMGTVNYMSPEQAKGERIDAATDIFSFGVVLYELIAGRTPFAGNTMSETFANLINAEPPPLSRFSANAPDELQRIVGKTLRKKRNERYQTMKDLLIDLKSLQKRLEFEKFGRSEPSADSLTPKKRNENITEHHSAVQSPAVTVQKSIAVLPFANMSADAENEYFCDGLAEELLNALAKIKNLKVAARTSAFSFKNRNVEVGEIGKTLNVKTILEGSVRKSGNKLRITVQLIDAADGYQIWSKRYDGELKDIFDLQDEITLAVIDELKVQFLSGEKTAIRNRYADNVEAYQLYLKGRFHYLKLRLPEIQTGISYFQQAIELDSSYALAYVGLAQALQTLPLAAELAANEFFPQAKAAAYQAIEIDAELAEAHGVLGWLLFWFDWNWNSAESECLLALELNRESADAHEAYAHLLSNIGRDAESLAEIKRAVELDPLNLRINAFVGQFLLHAGKTDEALAQLRKTLELEPNFWLAHLYAASAYIEKEMFAEAVAEADLSKQFSGGSSHAAALGIYALAKSGKHAEAAAALAEMLQLSTVRHVPPYHFALAYQGLNNSHETFSWLEKGYEQRDPKMAFLKVEPKWHNLRHEPRFIELMKRMNFE